MPEVENVAYTWGASPMEGDDEDTFWFVGRPKPARSTELPMALFYLVSPDYGKTLGLTLKRGRFFNEHDNERTAPVAVIDETLAEKYFHNRNPIGQYLEINDTDQQEKQPNLKIVGVVGHVNQWGLAADADNSLHAQIYLPATQVTEYVIANLTLPSKVFVRSKPGTTLRFENLRRKLAELNSGLVAFDPEFMDAILSNSIASKRFAMTLLTAFAGIALLLASIGIYGVLSYLVGQRKQEIGVRMVLGARRADVLRMILTDGARMTALGMAIGVVAALGLAQWMASLLFGVASTDPFTFALVIFTLSAIALLACYLPARRAMNIDPMSALREE